jgi:putative DNA primase/helicase
MENLAPISVNAEMIAQHLDLLFRGTDGYAPIRLLQEKEGVPFRKHLPFVALGPDLAAKVLVLARQAADGGGATFLVPGTVATPGSAKSGDIVQIACLLVDLDSGDIAAARHHLEGHLGQASMVVVSGGLTEAGQERLHLYWRLTAPVSGENLQRLCKLRGILAAKVGGDPAFASAHQPIRLAGSVYAKAKQRRAVKIIAQSELTYDFETLDATVCKMPGLEGLARPGFVIDTGIKGPTVQSLKIKEIRADGVDEVTRFQAMGAVIGHWLHVVRIGQITMEEAWQHVVDHNAARISPPWDEAKLRASFKSMQRLDVKKHGPMPDLGFLTATRDDASRSGARDESAQSESPGTLPDAAFLSEDDLANRFASRFRRDLRYAPARGSWMVWNGKVWKADETKESTNRVRMICRIAAAEINDEKMARKLGTERTINAVEKLARTDPRLAEGGAAWDRGNMVINTPEGVVDLTSGEIRPHEASDLFTRITGACPGAGCPRWLQFLDEVTGGKPGMVEYLQRVAGYCLTGAMTAQVFFFLHGNGANGKSIFISALSDVLGDYAATAPRDTFTSSHGDRHPTDLAGIATARAVFVTETEHNKPWAESRIKAITGGDTLRVRFLYQNFFEIDPTFKIMVAGNSRPRLNGVGEAMRRRLHLIPFDVTIPPEARQLDLQQKLHEERDGIFSWMLQGCAAWQAGGLSPPDCIRDAAAEYFRDEDLVGQWIEEACQTAEGAQASSTLLYSSWSEWAKTRGFEAGSQRSLGEELRARGFKQYRTPRERGWLGLRPLHTMFAEVPRT